ncbi:MAG: class I SAM-dependent methyltransferase, partial [Gemmatimonadales bacterium]
MAPSRPASVGADGSFIRSLADNSDSRSLATRMRRRRFQLFLSLLAKLEGHVEILDIGGTQQFWDLMLGDESHDIRVTLLNLDHQHVPSERFVSAQGDARAMPELPSGSFDVVFSNSVIEHVGSYENQRQMANEIRRVGRRFFVQTPNKRFPLEPHFLFPWFQYLPVSTRAWLVNTFNVGWYKRIPDARAARAEVESIQLLTRKRFRELFPEARIHEEKIAGLTKSFVAIGG